jgi:hypothetical protein
MSSMSKRSWLIVAMLVDLRHWPSMLNSGAFLMTLLTLGNRGRICVVRQMLHRYLILHGLQKLISTKFREWHPELAVGRRQRRQDVAADEEAQMVSAVGLESSLWSSDTWAGKRLKIQKKHRKITFAEDLISYFQEDL